MPHSIITSDAAAERRTGEHLPVRHLLALAVAGFLAIMTENVPAGLLPQISAGLQVSSATAGHFVTLYALGSVVAAIPVIAYTRHWNRRPLFMLAITGLLVFNTITALSAHLGLALMARFSAGMAAGVVWGLIAVYARRLAPPHLQGRAMAIAGFGQPVALALGVPLGALLGGLSNWRLVFWIISAVALLLLAWVRLGLPDFSGQVQDKKATLRQTLAIRGVRPVLMVLLAWILAHNILYTYIAPFMAAGDTGLRTDIVLLVFGACAVTGIWLTGAFADRHLRSATLLSLAAFAGAAVLLALSRGSPTLTLAAIAIWGLTLGGSPTLLQTALADCAGDHADLAQSIFVTVFNLAIAGGAAIGAFVLDHDGVGGLPWLPAMLALFALVTIHVVGRHGFPAEDLEGPKAAIG